MSKTQGLGMKIEKKRQIKNNHSLKFFLVSSFLFLVVCLTWGTTWLGIKIAVETIPPLTASGLRFLIAFPLFMIFSCLRKEPLTFPSGMNLFFIFVIVFYFTLPYFLLSFGEQFVSSGLTSLIFSTMPVFILIFSLIFLKEKIWVSQLLGIGIGFFCLYMIIQSEGLLISSKGAVGFVAILSAAVMHALCYTLTKKMGSKIPVTTFNTLPIGISGGLLFCLGIIIERPDISAISAASWYATLYLGVVASVGGFIVYFYLLKRIDAVLLSFVFIVFPVFSIAIGAWYESHDLSTSFIYYAALMLLGFGLTKIPLERYARQTKKPR